MYQSRNFDIDAVGNGNEPLSLTPYYRPPGFSRVDAEIDLDVMRVIRDALPIISSTLILSALKLCCNSHGGGLTVLSKCRDL